MIGVNRLFRRRRLESHSPKMASGVEPRPTIRTCATAITGLFGLAATAEFVMGRKLWGISGRPGLWSGDIVSEHNSQYMADPYTFSHVTHGMLYGALALTARRLPLRVRAVLAVAIECLWEIVENTDFVIQRYRAETISLHYYGDSVMNSMCDVAAALAGFMIASILPPPAAAAAIVILETALALWVRDGVFLNILMLLHPVPAVRAWQARG